MREHTKKEADEDELASWRKAAKMLIRRPSGSFFPLGNTASIMYILARSSSLSNTRIEI